MANDIRRMRKILFYSMKIRKKIEHLVVFLVVWKVIRLKIEPSFFTQHSKNGTEIEYIGCFEIFYSKPHSLLFTVSFVFAPQKNFMYHKKTIKIFQY